MALSRELISASSLYTSLLQVINGLMTFTLCPQVVSQKVSDLLRSKAFVMVTLCITVYLLGHFPQVQNVQGSASTKVFTGVYPVNTVIPVHCSKVVSASFCCCCCCCCHELCRIFIKYLTVYQLPEGHHFVAY